MLERIVGMAIGTRVHTEHGVVVNGSPLRPGQRAALRAQGFELVSYDGKPEPGPVTNETFERDAADMLLGINRGVDGKPDIAKDFAQAKRDAEAPLRKSFYFRN